jgi:NAD+ diphosphatase
VARVPIEVILPYNGLTLDRAAGLREDPGWLDKIRLRDGARTVVFWQDKCLVAGDRPVEVPPAELETVFLGMDGEAGVFAADLSALDETAATERVHADAAVDIRRLFTQLSADQAAILAYAKGILHWQRNERFCGACGSPAESRDAGHLRVCTGCGRLLFPRIAPAVIMLVEAPGGEKCLLARHRGAAVGSYSTLAGFVEIGESLEDAVRRELAEEAGVRVADVAYQGSQAWPFPAGLMLGFRAVAATEEVTVDENELIEARWFTRDEVIDMLATGNSRTDSIEHFLVGSWLAEEETIPRR